jgi:hypothetical protein
MELFAEHVTQFLKAEYEQNAGTQIHEDVKQI